MTEPSDEVNLSTLIERVEKATGPDGRLDHDILLTLGARYEHDWGPEYYFGEDREYRHEITRDTDYALALVERRGWRLWTVDASIGGRFSVMLASSPREHLFDDEGAARAYPLTYPDYATGNHATLQCATILALLRALQSEKPDDR